MRLIDADVMREEWLENGENEYVYDSNAILDCIDAQPTIEAVPVVHGEWKNGCCTNCGQVDLSKPNFCPNCGADMRKGGTE